MQRSRWILGVFACLLATFVLGQVPGTVPPVKMQPPVSGVIPPVKMRPAVPVKSIPAVTAAMEATEPFIARYAYCNAMQLYQSRRAAWEPIYLDAGATMAELDAYSGNLVTYIKEFCSNGRPPNYWQEALARVEDFDERVDSAMAASLGVSLQSATQLRISRLIVQLEKLRERCLGGDQAAIVEDQLSVFGSLLPATSAPPGLTLDPKPAAMSLGKCASGSGSAGSGHGGIGVDRETLSACVAGALEQSSSCVSPLGDGPSGAVVRRDDFGGGCSGIGKANICDTTERRVYANGAFTEVSTTRITAPGKDGMEHETRTERRRTVGNNGEVHSDFTRTFYDGVNTGVSGTGNEGADAVRMIREASAVREGLDLSVPTGFREVVEHVVAPDRRFQTHRRRMEPIGTLTAGQRRSHDCASVNPGSSQPLGFARVEARDDGRTGPAGALRLNTWDMVGQCVCTSLGRLGPGLAANSGFRCGPDENSRRLDCLLNPRGPADGIRPECVGYLNADNPHRDTRAALNEWCGHVAQCPPGAGMATAPSTSDGLTMCSCGASLVSPGGHGAGGSPGASRCATVSCGGGPGMAGSDLYQQCCGTPGGGLPAGVDPSTGSPVPAPRGPPEMLKQPLPKVPMQPLPDKSKLPPPPK